MSSLKSESSIRSLITEDDASLQDSRTSGPNPTPLDGLTFPLMPGTAKTVKVTKSAEVNESALPVEIDEERMSVSVPP